MGDVWGTSVTVPVTISTSFCLFVFSCNYQHGSLYQNCKIHNLALECGHVGHVVKLHYSLKIFFTTGHLVEKLKCLIIFGR